MCCAVRFTRPVIVTHAMDGCPATMKKWEKKAFLASDMANLTYNAYFIPYGEGGEETVTTTLGDFAVSPLAVCFEPILQD